MGGVTPDAIYTAWAFLLLLAGCIIGAALWIHRDKKDDGPHDN